MRLLSNNEQDLCRRILNGDGSNNYLGNIIDHKLDGVRISLTSNPNNVDLLFTIQNASPTQEETEMVIKRVPQITVEILTVVNLINLLEKEGYIMLLQQVTQVPQKSVLGRGISNLHSIKSDFADVKISELLIDYSTKEIFITEEFRQFCARNFIARDEQRFREQIARTHWALAITVIALIINIVFNLQPKFKEGIRFDQAQIDTIAQNLNEIENAINDSDSKLHSILRQDSLGRNFVEYVILKAVPTDSNETNDYKNKLYPSQQK